MDFVEFQKLLAQINKLFNPTWFPTKLSPIKGNKPYKVDHVDCGVDYHTGLINRIDVYTTDGEKKVFTVSKNLDAWTITKWLADGHKV